MDSRPFGTWAAFTRTERLGLKILRNHFLSVVLDRGTPRARGILSRFQPPHLVCSKLKVKDIRIVLDPTRRITPRWSYEALL
jgi:hypothetical protein